MVRCNGPGDKKEWSKRPEAAVVRASRTGAFIIFGNCKQSCCNLPEKGYGVWWSQGTMLLVVVLVVVVVQAWHGTSTKR